MDKAVQTPLNPVVLMSSDDWSETQKTIAIRLARGARVLYVNSIGLRSVRATRNDVNRMWSKLQQWLRGPRRVRDNPGRAPPGLTPRADSLLWPALAREAKTPRIRAASDR